MKAEEHSKKVALLGTGYTLERVAAQYAPEKILLAVRSAERVALLRKRGFCVEQVDFSDSSQARDFFARHAALETIVDSIPPRAVVGGEATDCVANIAAGLKTADTSVKKIIYLSTTGVYGVEDGSWVDETHALNPQHDRSRLRVQSEARYRESEVAVCCFRIAAIYGPGRGIGLSLKAGRYPYIADGQRWSNRIHVEDLARAIVLAIDSAQPLPEALNLADDLPSLTSDVVNFYCSKFSLPAPQPLTLEQARERGMDFLLSNQRVSNQLFKKQLGMELKFPSYREGAGSEFLLEEK